MEPTASRALLSRRALLGMAGVSALSACSILPRSPALDGAAVPDGLLTQEQAREVTFLALSLVDTPYRYGGNTPTGGFDCSGLLVYVFGAAARVPLPRTVAQIAQVGQPVPIAAVRTGDLVFFDAPGRFSHAGIYVGNARFVHAPSTGGRVRLDGVLSKYWRPRLSRITRV